MQRLPIGIQTFRKIIEEDYLYIDKTESIHTLITSGEIYFLSRPRRFGKSLLVSTLKEIFQGSRELFRNLYIYDKIEWQQHPVIHIDFSTITYDKSADVFEKSLTDCLDKIALSYNVTLHMPRLKDRFNELIENLNKINKVAVLIDEYDKPIIDFLTQPEKAEANREVLKNFFAVLKGADPYLRFVFLTGVSKFSKVSLFSGLNNILDITLDNRFSSMLGITEAEFNRYFQDYIKVLAKKEVDKPDLLKQKIKHWYNGYSWDGESPVYNPTSLLTLFTKYQFSNYWFATGTPTFLINLIKEEQYIISQIEEVEVTEEVFDSYDFGQVNINSLLLQTGYLTITKARKDKYSGITVYTLKYPNYEVHQSLLRYVMAEYIHSETALIQPVHIKLIQALAEKNISTFLKILTSVFAGIPYNLHINEEKYYHSLFYMVLSLMGVKIDLEVLSDKGRVDGVLSFANLIYVIEFKMGTAKDALAQIKTRKYYEQFISSGKEVLLLGVGGFGDKKIEYCLEEIY